MSNFDFIGTFLGKKAQLKKDGHDLSSLEVDSSPFGVIRPVACYRTVPNEHYEGKIGVNIQTAPMREDNFARIYSNLKAVYVPLDAIQRDYLSLTTSKRSTRKDGLLSSFSARAPYFNLPNVFVATTFLYWLQQGLQQITSISSWSSVYYDPDFEMWVDPSLNLDVEDSNFVEKRVVPVFGGESLAQYVLYFISRVSVLYSDTIFSDLQTAVERFSSMIASSGEAMPTSIFRMLDNLGYGNFIPVADDFIKRFPYYFANNISYDTTYNKFVFNGGRDSVLHTTYQALVEQCHYPECYTLFAFQYYIYLCEKSNYRNASTHLITIDEICNDIDSGYGSTYYSSHTDNSIYFFDTDMWTGNVQDGFFSEMLLDLHDFGNGYRFVDNSLHLWSEWDMFKYLFSTSAPLLEQDVYNSSQLSVVEGTLPYVQTADLNNNLIQTIADNTALYKLRQDLLRAGVRRDKQMNAIFGVSDTVSLYGDVDILDYSKSQIHINGLLNQAETDLAPLGQRAGRGDGNGGLSFKCNTKDFGFIFIVQYFTTELFYENFMIDRSTMLSPSEWFNPDFNHLGLESIHYRNLSLIRTNSSGHSLGSIVQESDSVLGFTARNYHLIQRVNKAHGLFTNFGFAISKNGEFNNVRYVPNNLQRGNAIFGGFVPTVIDQQTSYYLQPDSLYYNPYMVNNIFAQMVDSFVHSDMSFDQFRCAWTFNVHKVSPMPKLGLLRLDV